MPKRSRKEVPAIRDRTVTKLVLNPGKEYAEPGKRSWFVIGYDPDISKPEFTIKIGAVNQADQLIPEAYFQIEMISERAETGPGVSTFPIRSTEKFATFTVPADIVSFLDDYTMSIKASGTEINADTPDVLVAIVRFAALKNGVVESELPGGDGTDSSGVRKTLRVFLKMITTLNATVAEQLQVSSGQLQNLQEMHGAAREEVVRTREDADRHRVALEGINADLTRTIRMILEKFEEFQDKQLVQNELRDKERQEEWRQGREAAKTRNEEFTGSIDRQAEVLAGNIEQLAMLTTAVSTMDTSLQEVLDKASVLPKVANFDGTLQEVLDKASTLPKINSTVAEICEKVVQIASDTKELNGFADQLIGKLRPVLEEALKPVLEQMTGMAESVAKIQSAAVATSGRMESNGLALESVIAFQKNTRAAQVTDRSTLERILAILKNRERQRVSENAQDGADTAEIAGGIKDLLALVKSGFAGLEELAAAIRAMTTATGSTGSAPMPTPPPQAATSATAEPTVEAVSEAEPDDTWKLFWIGAIAIAAIGIVAAVVSR